MSRTQKTQETPAPTPAPTRLALLQNLRGLARADERKARDILVPKGTDAGTAEVKLAALATLARASMAPKGAKADAVDRAVARAIERAKADGLTLSPGELAEVRRKAQEKATRSDEIAASAMALRARFLSGEDELSE